MEALWILCGWQADHCGNIISIVRQRAASALLGDNELCYIKAETASAAVTASGSITSVKWFEKMCQILLIEMRLRIADLRNDLIFVLINMYRYLGTIRRIKYCIR